SRRERGLLEDIRVSRRAKRAAGGRTNRWSGHSPGGGFGQEGDGGQQSDRAEHPEQVKFGVPRRAPVQRAHRQGQAEDGSQAPLPGAGCPASAPGSPPEPDRPFHDVALTGQPSRVTYRKVPPVPDTPPLGRRQRKMPWVNIVPPYKKLL